MSSEASRRHTAVLDSETDFDGFRALARGLLQAGADPAQVDWAVRGATAAALAFDTAPVPARTDAAPAVRVPGAFVALARQVLLHADPQRFARLYRAAWRLQREPALRHDALDPELALLRRMAQAVRRDMHKMRAFVRFRPPAEAGYDTPLHVAWFEPQHHIVEANAPFFARRFTAMRWAILTPARSARWDGDALHFGPGGQRADAPGGDAGQALWLTYYRSIFNPARLKLQAMEKEMPRRYWRNLPEAALIAPLAADASQRRATMIEQPTTAPRRRIVPLARPAIEPAPAGDTLAAWHAARREAGACMHCPIGAQATQAVWGEGPLGARLMLVGEQPGDREDLEGRPFVGPAGELLGRAFAALGWARDALYLTNAVKHFKYEPRGKRRMHKTPSQREAEACTPWLEREIALVQPTALVALGATAGRALLGRPVAVLAERGRWIDERTDGRAVLVTLHPAALLRGDPGAFDAAFAAWVADLRRASGDGADR